MRAHIPILTFLLLGSLLAGCLGSEPEVDQTLDDNVLTPVEERYLQAFNVTAPYSKVLEEGVFGILDGLSIDIPVELPATEGGQAATGATVHMGLFLPEIEGCDWQAAELPEACKVPVVADIGPYYEDGDVAATEPARRLGGFLIDNLVPHGYAVAQVSVFGSGQSTHCMDLMGLSEQLGVDAAVTYLGEQPWSNGNVGLIGRSYDGSTPWQAAMFGNPALKTIVPISGLIGMHELMWRNGSAEFRGPIMHNVVYGQFGIDSVTIDPWAVLGLDPTNAVRVNEFDSDDVGTACKDYATGPIQGLGAYITGDHFAPAVNDYWSERYFLDRVLENYQGSVYLIQGMQDWNVDPHMAFPTHQLIEDKGLEIKGLYGQWNHMYPDRPSEHVRAGDGRGMQAFPETVRFDWAQDLLEWFDHYLKGTGPKPQLHVEIQDNQGGWRIEETYPPRDGTWVHIPMSDMTKLHSGDDQIVGTTALGEGEATILEYQLPAFEDETRIAGTPRFHVTVTPTGPGGQLFAYLYDKTDDLRLGHAVMDLRFAAGGKEMSPVAPGMPLVAKMEFEAMDVVVPAGHDVVLMLTATGEDYLPSVVSAPVTIDTSDASVLKLLTVDPAPEDFFTPVQWDVCTHPDMVQRADGSDGFKERLKAHGCPVE